MSSPMLHLSSLVSHQTKDFYLVVGWQHPLHFADLAPLVGPLFRKCWSDFCAFLRTAFTLRRSSARQEKRIAALRECARMVTTSAGGCTTPFPFEAAIWLLEEQEELFGGTFPVQNIQVRGNAMQASILSLEGGCGTISCRMLS